MKKVIILQGIPGSGKSTWAKEFLKGKEDWVRINRDDLRDMRGDYWVPEQEKYITDLEFRALRTAMSHNYNIVLDSTNLNPKTIKKIQDEVNQFNEVFGELIQDPYEIEFKLMDTPLEVCIERDAKRERSVGSMVITNFYNRYIKSDK